MTSYSMPISEAVELIMTVYAGKAVLVRGAPGATKTAQLLSAAIKRQKEDPEFGACCFNASNAQAPDFFGVWQSNTGPLTANAVPQLFQPVPEEGLRGAFPALCPRELVHPDASIQPIDPDLLYTAGLQRSVLSTYPRGLVIVDEASKVQGEDTMASLSMLAYEGRTGQWGVPTSRSNSTASPSNRQALSDPTTVVGWTRVFIANRAEDNSRDLDFPSTFDNRVAILDVHCTFDDVAPYWRSQGMHPSFVSFAGAYSGLILSNQVPAVRQQFGTARSWFEAHSECMAYCKSLGIESSEPDRYMPELLPVFGPNVEDRSAQRWHRTFIGLIAARCGEAIASQFSEYLLASTDLPTYDEIVSNPETCIIPEHPGVIHAVVETLLTNTDLCEIDEIGKYLKRPEFPKAMACVYLNRMMDRHPIAAASSNKFFALVRHFGIAASMTLHHSR